MIIKRIMVFLLVVLLFTSTIISCTNDIGHSLEMDGGSTFSETGVVTTEPDELQPNLPKRDFEGHAINFLVRGEAYQPTNFSVEIFSDGFNGEPINDAVFLRNKYVEDLYNVKITQTENDDSADHIRKSVLAGDDAFDVAMMGIQRLITLVEDGFLQDLNEVPYLDLVNPWWNKGAVDGLKIGNRIYFTTGDINIMDNNAIWAAMFNKNLFDEYGIEHPYELVRSGGWTLDKLGEYVKKGGRDLDGDDKMTESDEYGMIFALENVYPLVVAAGEIFTAVSNEGTIEMAVDVEGTSRALDGIISFVSDKTKTLLGNDYSSKYQNFYSELLRQSFREGRGLLYISGILSSTYLRDMENEFGIIPLPKINELQYKYQTRMQLNNCSAFAIPAGSERLEMIGIVSEALAAKSMYTLTPAYYEVTLSGKVVRDDDSIEMLDIILDSVVFDWAIIYNLGNINGLLENNVKNGSNTFASGYAAIEKSVDTMLEKINKSIITK